MSQFRVIKILKDDFTKDETKSITEATYWEGDSVDELSEKYPPSRIFGADPLGFSSIEDGWITWRFRFEKLEEGAWAEIDDPRVRHDLDVLTELEAAIDAENRRMFPGDFIEEDVYGDSSLDDDWPEDPDALRVGAVFTQDQLDEIEREREQDRLYDVVFIEQWEKSTAIKWRSPNKEERELIRQAEDWFGGREKLWERRAQLAAQSSTGGTHGDND